MKVALLGLGHMGWALAEALSKTAVVSSLTVWNRTIARAGAFVRRHGVDATLFEAMASMLDRAREAGEGERDVSALIRSLRTEIA